MTPKDSYITKLKELNSLKKSRPWHDPEVRKVHYELGVIYQQLNEQDIIEISKSDDVDRKQ